jgi:hypothetical protein
MTTVQFFQIVFDHLTEDGVMVINIGRSPLDRTLVNDLGTTVEEVFPRTFVMDIPGSFNTMLFATKQQGSWDDFLMNYNMLYDSQAAPLLLEVMGVTYMNRQPPFEHTQIYTDDRAPIELLTNKIVVDFILSGSAEELQ